MLLPPEPLNDNVQDLELPEPEPLGSFQDVPGAICGAFLSAWSVFFLLLIIFFTTNAAATFVVTIVVLFALMAFGLPSTSTKMAMSSLHTRRCRRLRRIRARSGSQSVGTTAPSLIRLPSSTSRQ